MSKFVSPKSTGGSGFYFEDKITVYLCLLLLSDKTFPFDFSNSKNIISEIGLQKRNEGWYLDDIVIKLQSGQILPVTIKKYNVFKANKIDAEVLTSLYKQYLTTTASNDYEKIRMCIFDTNNNPKQIKEFIKYISTNENSLDTIKTILLTNKYYNKLFESFRTILNDEEIISIDDTKIITIIKKLDYFNFDFESNDSQSHQTCIELSRKLLISNDVNEAGKLFSVLIEIIQEAKSSSASVSKNFLLEKIGHRFDLKIFPRYSEDINKLRKFTENNTLSIETTINGIQINQDKEKERLKHFIDQNRITVVYGESGCGKTSFLKFLYEDLKNSNNFIWLNYSDLECPVNDFLSNLGLKFDLSELINNNPHLTFTFIVEGLDKSYSEQVFSNVNFLIILLSKLISKNAKLVLSSQTDELSRINLRINSYINPLKYFELQKPTEEDLLPLFELSPNLHALISIPHLNSILKNFQVLKIIILNHENSENLKNIIEEIDIIEWYWNSIILSQDKSILIQNLIFKLLDYQSNDYSYTISVSHFSNDEIILIQTLKDRHLFIFDSINNRISFSHKLINDWAKYLYIKSAAQESYSELSRFLFWKNGFKYYSIYILRTEFEQWKRLYEFSKDNPTLKNSLLEGLFCSSNSSIYYEKVHQEIFNLNHNEFYSFVNLFLFYATAISNHLPNTYAEPSIIDSEIFILTRYPIFIYWIPFLIFLLKYRDIYLKKISDSNLIIIIILWLKNTQKGFIFRNELAKIGITVVQKKYAWNQNVPKLFYTLAIYCLSEYPEEVKELLEIASGKIKPKGEVKRYIDLFEQERKSLQNTKLAKLKRKINKEKHHIPYFPKLERKCKPFKYGPVASGDHYFLDFIVSTYFTPIIYYSNPYFLNKILLSSIIKENIQSSVYNHSRLSELEFGINRRYEWSNPSYHDSSFYTLMQINHEAFLDFSIKLLNFFTNRFIVDSKKFSVARVRTFKIKIYGIPAQFIGDENSISFYSSTLTPQIVKNVLIVLEKFLIENSDNYELVKGIIIKLISKCKNISLLGILIVLAKHNNKYLFEGFFEVLKMPQLIDWDERVSLTPNFYMSSLRMTAFQSEDLKQWYDLPSRKKSFVRILQEEMIFGTHKEKLLVLEKHFTKLIKKYSNSDLHSFLLRLIGVLNRENYSLKKLEEKLYIEFDNKDMGDRENIKVAQNKSDWELKKISLPITLHQILKNNSVITEHESKQYYAYIEKISCDESGGYDLISKEDTIAGIISVLLCNSNDWLLKDNKKYQKCITILVKLCQNFNEHKIGSNHAEMISSFPFKWYNFCCYSIPFLANKESINKELKECLFNIIITNNYNCLSELMNNLYLNKIPIEVIFQLINIGLEINSFNILRNSEIDNTFIPLLKEKYLENKIPEEVYNLIEFNKRETDKLYKHVKDHPHAQLGFSTQIIRFLFSWMYNDNFNQNKFTNHQGEQENLLDFFIFLIENESSYDRDNLYPSDFDDWSINKLIFYLLFFSNQKSVEYKTSYLLNIKEERFISSFLGHLIQLSLHFKKEASLIKILEDMISFYQTNKNTFSWSEYNSIMKIICGIDQTCYVYFTTDNKIVLKNIFEMTKEFYSEIIYYTSDYSEMINFFIYPACEAFILDTLKIVNPIFTKFFNEKQKINDTTFTYLKNLYDNHFQEIKRNAELYKDFFSMFDKLLSIQHHPTLKLAEELVK